ncbi:MAG: phosphomannomutase/phosphoglucomutase [Candidatus Accumulibacter meliphilus]|jgi:phosphomannomutase/phosphoglucomutase|uniref:Phosphomannomutase/phosphoglucomutase n=1 Tax=Candidatus Accumulibacter meliphilus TaxID=2211374 RepID=A0A369XJ50_9PROT|nr:MAG: phosphomannomutase/phosphoglucomutase [Candidatus Accumulibacter meliphilus]
MNGSTQPNITPLPAEIFKAYDIRGIVGKTLTSDNVRRIGHGLGSLAAERGQRAIAVGRDGRLSGPELATALMAGIRLAGIDTIDIGCVPTPVAYFAAHELGCNSCVAVTGSHNPPDYNGLKMVVGGETLAGETIQGIRRRVDAGELRHGAGQASSADVLPAYLARIVADVHLARPMKIVVDCGNGVAGVLAAPLFRALGCELVELFCAVDGNFPNHHPDPSKPENLQDVIRALRDTDAELGLAFDGDGDRLGVVTKDGQIIYPDRQLMLFAADVLSRCPGQQIIYDVKCTRQLAPWIREHGGEPLMWKTGHALVKAKLKETGAPLAGEMSGHVFFKERWFGFDDGLYAGARLLEILSRSSGADAANALLTSLPDSSSTPELNIAMQEGEPLALIEELRRDARFTDAREIITIDGLRIEYADGFGLARPSNTTPVVVLRFEADSQAALERIQADFRRVIHAARPGLALPF